MNADYWVVKSRKTGHVFRILVDDYKADELATKMNREYKTTDFVIAPYDREKSLQRHQNLDLVGQGG